MNEIWHKITRDRATLPPLDVPVFAAGGSLHGLWILVRSAVSDENGDPAWGWCVCDGDPYWDSDKRQWTVWGAIWDDDYEPEYWHAFPAEPPEGIS